VILAVLAESPDVCSTPEPSVYLANYGDFAITFKIKFFITDFNRLDAIQSGVMDRLWYAFRREGISIPYPIQDCRERDAGADEEAARMAALESIRKLLAGVDLLQSLTASGVERLALTSKLMMFAQGEKLCRQDEAGESLYIIRSGSVGVWVAGPDGNSLPVAHLGAGAFFGEMSLLTGEPRSATVTAEGDVEVVCISKSDFAGLLQMDADLAGKLAATLESRFADRQAKVATMAQRKLSSPSQSVLLTRIRHFFGIAS
jgi:CRP-like cAMP-binding protein